MIKKFYAFKKQLDLSDDTPSFLLNTYKGLLPFGIEHFAYAAFRDSPKETEFGKFDPELSVTNYSLGWISEYIGREYHLIDPVFDRLTATDEPFFWPDKDIKIKQCDKQRKFFESAARHDIARGLCVPLRKSAEGPRAVVFAASGGSRAFDRTSSDPKNLVLFKLFAFYMHVKLMELSHKHQPRPLTPTEETYLTFMQFGLTNQEAAILMDKKKEAVGAHGNEIRARLGLPSIASAMHAMTLLAKK